MKSLTVTLSVLLGSCLLVDSALAQGNQLYRWVDDQGKVHFGDRIDGAQAAKDLDRFNSQGIRLSRADAKPNQQELRELEEVRRTAFRDSALLSGYQSEMELLKAHDEQRAVMEFSLRTSQSNIARLRREISERPETASTNGPGDQVVIRLRAQLEAEELSLQQLQQRRFDLYETQNQELARYRELSRDLDESAHAPSA